MFMFKPRAIAAVCFVLAFVFASRSIFNFLTVAKVINVRIGGHETFQGDAEVASAYMAWEFFPLLLLLATIATGPRSVRGGGGGGSYLSRFVQTVACCRRPGGASSRYMLYGLSPNASRAARDAALDFGVFGAIKRMEAEGSEEEEEEGAAGGDGDTVMDDEGDFGDGAEEGDAAEEAYRALNDSPFADSGGAADGAIRRGSTGSAGGRRKGGAGGGRQGSGRLPPGVAVGPHGSLNDPASSRPDGAGVDSVAISDYLTRDRQATGSRSSACSRSTRGDDETIEGGGGINDKKRPLLPRSAANANRGAASAAAGSKSGSKSGSKAGGAGSKPSKGGGFSWWRSSASSAAATASAQQQQQQQQQSASSSALGTPLLGGSRDRDGVISTSVLTPSAAIDVQARQTANGGGNVDEMGYSLPQSGYWQQHQQQMQQQQQQMQAGPMPNSYSDPMLAALAAAAAAAGPNGAQGSQAGSAAALGLGMSGGLLLAPPPMVVDTSHAGPSRGSALGMGAPGGLGRPGGIGFAGGLTGYPATGSSFGGPGSLTASGSYQGGGGVPVGGLQSYMLSRHAQGAGAMGAGSYGSSAAGLPVGAYGLGAAGGMSGSFPSAGMGAAGGLPSLGSSGQLYRQTSFSSVGSVPQQAPVLSSAAAAAAAATAMAGGRQMGMASVFGRPPGAPGIGGGPLLYGLSGLGGGGFNPPSAIQERREEFAGSDALSDNSSFTAMNLTHSQGQQLNTSASPRVFSPLRRGG
jgi:hypothetical protein